MGFRQFSLVRKETAISQVELFCAAKHFWVIIVKTCIRRKKLTRLEKVCTSWQNISVFMHDREPWFFFTGLGNEKSWRDGEMWKYLTVFCPRPFELTP
jgi:hypothetical protein